MNKEQSVKVFVYGTLKKGHWNNYLLNAHKEAIFVCEDHLTGFTLLEKTIPFAVKAKNESKIFGEVWDISLPALNVLDGLEGHPFVYTRETHVTGSGHEVFVYIWNNETTNFRHCGEEWHPPQR